MTANRPISLRHPWHRRLLSRTALSGLPLAIGAVGMALLPGTALALPQDGVVAEGAAAIAQTGALSLAITQSTNAAIIDWQSFDIGAGETVEVFQPSAMATLLNRVVGGGGASNILGQLSATGRLTLINPAGIMIGNSARIDVAGLIASTANIGNADFMAGNHAYATPGLAGARIVNAGAITATDGGLVALVGPSVANSGAINARLGRVVLGSAETFTLDLYGDDLIHIGVDDAVMTAIAADALVANSGAITADGGVIQITARGGAAAIENVINMSGVVRARSVGMENGEVVFYGHDQGIVQVSGSVDTSGKQTGQTGGTIKVLGDKVALTGNANLDASGDAGGGTILVGGAFQGLGDTPTASRSFVGRHASINTSAISTGNAGTAIVWADGDTRYYGSIAARGGALSGNGGTVEVSGKQNLGFDGAVDTSAPNGQGGSLLLDPDKIVVQDNGPSADDADQLTPDGNINFDDPDGPLGLTFFISENALEALTTSGLVLQAYISITINNLDGDGILDLTGISEGILFTTKSTAADAGFFMNAGDTIKFDVEFDIDTVDGLSAGTGDINLGKLNGIGGFSSVFLTSGGQITFNGASTMGSLSAIAEDGITVNANLTSTSGDIVVDADLSNDGGVLLFANSLTVNSAGEIALGSNELISAAGHLTLLADSLVEINDNFAGAGNLSIGSSDEVVFDGDLSVMGNLDIDALSIIEILGETNVGGAAVITSVVDDVAFDNLFTAGGAFTVNAGDDITLNGLNAGGIVIINADTGEPGGGNFHLGSESELISNGFDVSIKADGFNLGDFVVNAGAGDVTLSHQSADTFCVGGDGCDDGDNLDSFELSLITAGSLSIISNTSLKVGPIAADVSDGFGPLSLTSTESDIVFTDPNVFQRLAVNAAGGIRVNANLTIVTGDVMFNADSDASGSGSLRVADGATLTASSGGIDLFAADVDLGGSGAISAATFFRFTQTAGAAINLGVGAGEGGDADGLVINDEIDDVFFSTTATGLVVINVTPTRVDDAEWDPEINLFFDDGSLGLEDHIANDDDGGEGHASFLSLSLLAGDYRLRIANFNFDAEEALGDTHPGFDRTFTDYELSIEGAFVTGFDGVGGGGSGLSASELQRITAGGGNTSFTTAGDIVVDGVSDVAGLGDVTLTGHHIFFQGEASEFAGAVELFADDLVEIDADLSSQSLLGVASAEGGLIDVLVNLGADAPFDFVHFTADTVSLHDVSTNGPQNYGNGVVIFNSTYRTGGGAFAVAGSVVALSPSTISTGGGPITIAGTVSGAGASALVFDAGGGPVLVAGVDPTGPSVLVEDAAVDSSNAIDALVEDDVTVSEDDADEEDILEEEDEEGEEAEAEDPYLDVVEEEDLGESGDAEDDEGSSPGCACGA